MPGMYSRESAKEKSVPRLGEVNSRTGQETAVQRSDYRHQNDQGNQLPSAAAHYARGDGRSYVIAGSNLGNRQHTQVGHIGQQVDGSAHGGANAQRQQN